MSYHFLDHSDKARPLILALEPLLEKERDLVFASYARLLARLPMPHNLPPGESYQVDLSRPLLEHTADKQVITSGPVQLVGTLLPQRGHWVWGWNNPAIPPVATAEVKQVVEGHAALRDLGSCVSFHAEERFLELLTGYVALQGGFHGIYRSPVGEAVAYLAVDFGEDKIWCMLCGLLNTQVRALIAGTHGHVCNQCIDGTLQDVFADLEKKEGVNYLFEFTPPCAMCGEKPNEPHVNFPMDAGYSMLCRTCYGAMREAVRPPSSSGPGSPPS